MQRRGSLVLVAFSIIAISILMTGIVSAGLMSWLQEKFSGKKNEVKVQHGKGASKDKQDNNEKALGKDKHKDKPKNKTKMGPSINANAVKFISNPNDKPVIKQKNKRK